MLAAHDPLSAPDLALAEARERLKAAGKVLRMAETRLRLAHDTEMRERAVRALARAREGYAEAERAVKALSEGRA